MEGQLLPKLSTWFRARVDARNFVLTNVLHLHAETQQKTCAYKRWDGVLAFLASLQVKS
jgi:hypothetical protein